MRYNISVNNKKVEWKEGIVKLKLENLGSLAGKKVAWIKADLTTKKSNWLTRLIWTVVAKHFAWMRRSFYGVNLKTSNSVLQQISRQIPKNSDIAELYNRAVTKFKEVAPKHAKSLELIKPEEKELLEDICSLQEKLDRIHSPQEKPKVQNDENIDSKQHDDYHSDDGWGGGVEPMDIDSYWHGWNSTENMFIKESSRLDDPLSDDDENLIG